MADSASNQKRTIATEGTTHVATTPADVCYDPRPDPPVPPAIFENHARMRFLQNGTVSTEIQECSIWTAPAQVGPVSDPAHPPHVIGVVSQVEYRQEAKAVEVSKDVIAEGNGVVRTNDPTTQNHANAKGTVDGGAGSPGKDTADEFLKKHCVITKVYGICSHGRRLGFPAPGGQGEPFYLEILSGDTVAFKVERRDVTKSPQPLNPPCDQGHTKWLATRPTILNDKVKHKTPRTTGAGEEFDIGPELTVLTPADDEMVGDLGSHAARSAGKEIPGLGGAAVSTTSMVSWMTWARTLLLRYNPPVITVEARGCAGAKTAVIKVHPAQGLRCNIWRDQNQSKDVTDEAKTRFGTILERAEKACAFVAKLANAVGLAPAIRIGLPGLYRAGGYAAAKAQAIAGGPKRFEIELLASPFMDFQLQYVECNEEKGFWSKKYTPACVGCKWTLELGFAPLFGFRAHFRISLIPFFGVVGLVGSAVVQELEQYFDLPGIYLDVDGIADLTVKGQIGQDEYDFPALLPKPIGRLDIEAKLALVVSCIVKVSAEVTVIGVIESAYEIGKKPRVLLGATCTAHAHVQGSLTFFKDTWVEWRAVTYAPDWAKWDWSQWVDIWTL